MDQQDKKTPPASIKLILAFSLGSILSLITLILCARIAPSLFSFLIPPPPAYVATPAESPETPTPPTPAEEVEKTSDSEPEPPETDSTLPPGLPDSETPSESTALLLPSPEEFPAIIDLVRTDYFDSASLINEKIDEAFIKTLMEKHPHNIRLLESPLKIPTQPSPLTEKISPHILYWKPSSLSSEEIANFTSDWPQHLNSDTRALILDLRSFGNPNNFQGAVSLASLFLSPDTHILSLEGIKTATKSFHTDRQPLPLSPPVPHKKSPPISPFPLSIIIDHQTRGCAEFLAQILRKKASAILIGSQTPGETALFTETKLASGRYLRIASAKALLPETGNLLGTPAIPDIHITPDSKKTAISPAHDEWYSLANENFSALISEISPPPRPDPQNQSFLPPESSSADSQEEVRKDFILRHTFDMMRAILISHQPAEQKIK